MGKPKITIDVRNMPNVADRLKRFQENSIKLNLENMQR